MLGIVRLHDLEDTESLVEMYLDFDPADRTMGLPPATEPRLRRWLDRFTEDGWSLIAEVDDTVAGHAGVTPAIRRSYISSSSSPTGRRAAVSGRFRSDTSSRTRQTVATKHSY